MESYIPYFSVREISGLRDPNVPGVAGEFGHWRYVGGVLLQDGKVGRNGPQTYLGD